MRRFAWILALALCLALLAGCGVEDVLGNMMGPRIPEPTQTPGPTEVPIWTPPAEASATAVPSPVPTAPAGGGAPAPAGGIADYASLTVADCVEDAGSTPGVIPHIRLDCPGAQSINAAIDSAFAASADDPLWETHYECAIGGSRVLSVLMVQQANDSVFYTAYNLDMATGQALTGAELLALLGQDPAALKAKELAVMAQEFTHLYGGLIGQMDQSFYDQQYARTTSIDNAQTDNLWFGADGQLYFTGRIYAMAGAEYYESALPTGVTF